MHFWSLVYHPDRKGLHWTHPAMLGLVGASFFMPWIGMLGMWALAYAVFELFVYGTWQRLA